MWTQSFGLDNRSYMWTESSPTVDPAGRVYVGSKSSLWAVNLTTGRVLWQYDTQLNPSIHSEFFATPAVSGNLVLAGTGAGTMYGFAGATGQVVWQFETADVVRGTDGGTGKAPITGSVVLGEIEAYVGGWDGRVYAFDPSTGAVRWRYQATDADSHTAAQIRATPALSPDGSVVHFPAGRALYAVNASTGTELWVLQTNQTVYTSPVVAADGTVVYGASGGGMATAVSPTGRVLWWVDRAHGFVPVFV
jgi:outer membrane protein assembly factor BamB